MSGLGAGESNMSADTLKPDLDILVICCATSAQTCFYTALSEQAKCASPGEKDNALKTRLHELSSPQSRVTAPAWASLGRAASKCCSQGILITWQDTTGTTHELVQSVIVMTATPPSLQGAWSIGLLGLRGPKLATMPNHLIPFLIKTILWNV